MKKANLFDFHYTCLLPGSLDIDKLLQEHEIKVEKYQANPARIRDRLAYVLNSLVRSTNKLLSHGEISDRSGYGRICSQRLQEVIRDYKLYLDYLVNNGVIERGVEGKKSEKCTEYRFTAKFRSEHFRSYTILDTGFLKAIFSKKRDKTIIAKYQKQFKYLQGLEVDWRQAHQILDKLYGNDAEKKETQIKRLKTVEDRRRATFHTGSTGRLYTTICNIRKKLRQALRLEGKMLVEMDIRNSIPFFSTALFTNTFYEQGFRQVTTGG
jgi:hypothetical protein